MGIESLDVRRRIYKSLHCLYKVTPTDIVDEVERNKRDSELKVDTFGKFILLQEGLKLL